MDPYRSAPTARVVHTKLAHLPAATQTVLLEALRKKGGGPQAIPLSPKRQGRLILLGLALTLAAVAAYNARGGLGLLEADRALILIGLAALGAASVVYGVVFALRGMSLRLRPLAALYPDGWLTCATGLGSHVDMIPLVAIEKVVPATLHTVEVRLRSGEVLGYPARFEVGLGAFYDAAGAAVAAAANTVPPDTRGIAKELPRPSGLVPAVLALTLGAVAGGAGGVAAVMHDAQRQARLLVENAEYGLEEANHPDEYERPDAMRVSSLEFFFAQTATARAVGGLPTFFFTEFTDIATHEERFRPILDAARTVTNAANDAQAQDRAETSTHTAELRRISDAHPDDAIGETAREHLRQLVIAARARAVEGGASPSALALCDWLHARSAQPPVGALRVTVVRSPSADDALFEAYPDAFQALRGAYEAASAVTEPLNEVMHNALGELAPADPDGLAVRVEVALFPGGEALTYTSQDTRTRVVRSSYTVPVLHARTRIVLSLEGGTLELEATHAALAQPMSERNMAEAYPTAERLYAAEGQDVARQIAGTIARALCVP